MDARTRRSARTQGIEGPEAGAAAAVATILLVVFLSVAALVADFGFILVKRTELSKAVDAAALAGAQDLPNQTAARKMAIDYVGLNVSKTAVPDSTITFPQSNVIRVSANLKAPAFFAKVVGIRSFDVPAVAEATRYDPNLAIIIDRSGSMCEQSHPSAGANCPAIGPWEPFTTIQKIAKGFVDEMGGDPQMTLISYSTTAHLDLALSTNRALMKTKIDGLKPSGYTDIAASVEEAIDQLLRATGPEPKMVILLTDGRTNTVNGKYLGDNHPAAIAALRNSGKKAKKEGIPIFGINYGVDVDNDLMREISEESDGHFYHAPNNNSLKVVYSDIAGKAYIRLTYVH